MIKSLALLCTFMMASSALADAPPNVVFIVSDDQAWSDYGFMGHPQVKTPNLDRLASQSLLFTRGYVPSSLCCPSLAAIISGQYPHQNFITSNDPPALKGKKGGVKDPDFIAGREVFNRHMDRLATLPRLLAAKGYNSFQTGKWWQGNFSRGGFTHGMTKGERHGDAGLTIGRESMQPIYDFVSQSVGEKKPFFLWYAPLMPHDPHTPPERLLAKYRDKTPSLHVAKYWAMIEWFDETCGQLMDYLDARKLSENTIIVYLSDNGWIQNPEAPKYAPRSKQSQYDGGLRTPIMVRWPAKVKPRKSEALAMSVDLAPTVLRAIGMEPAREMTGVNLLDEVAVNARKSIQGEIFTHNSMNLEVPSASLRWRWIIQGDYKLIVPHPANEKNAPVELYSILKDENETKNIAADQPDLVKAMSATLDAWWKP